MTLTPKEQAMLALAKEQHYLVKEPAHLELEKRYHEYCVSEQIYWISIHLHELDCTSCNIGEDHADIWYDLFHLNHALTSEAYQALQELFDRAQPGIYKDIRNDLGQAGGHGTVPEYTAEKLVKSLIELFSNPQNHSEEMFYRVYPRIGRSAK